MKIPGPRNTEGFPGDPESYAVTAGVQTGHTPTALLQFSNNQWTAACSSQPCYDNAGNQTNVAGDVQTYDAEGRRVSKTDSVGGTVVSVTVYGYDVGGALATEYSTQPSVQTSTEYMSADHLGSDRLITNAGGGTVKPFTQLVTERPRHMKVSRYGREPESQE